MEKSRIIDRLIPEMLAAKGCGAAERTSLGCFRAFTQNCQRRGIFILHQGACEYQIRRYLTLVALE